MNKIKRIIFIITVVTIIWCTSCGTKTEYTIQEESSEIESSSEEIESTQDEPQMTDEERLLENLTAEIGEDVANEALDILKNQIGFSCLTFLQKMGDTDNYSIYADGQSIILTASDKVYRVFMPNSDYVFYEDDTVKMTASSMLDRQIDSTQQSYYYIMAQDIVKSALKNPRSADFPSIITHAGEIAIQRNGSLVAVKSYVDATNSFGAKVRTNWTVQFVVYDMENFSYEAVYINMDGQKSGEFIDFDEWTQ